MADIDLRTPYEFCLVERGRSLHIRTTDALTNQLKDVALCGRIVTGEVASTLDASVCKPCMVVARRYKAVTGLGEMG